MAEPVYNDAVAAWFRQEPRPLEGVSGIAGSEEQGARVVAAARIEGGSVANLAFRAFACPHIIAACNLLAERLTGQAPEALVDPALPEHLQELEIPVEKTGKILILQDALRACYEACATQ